MNVYAFFFFCYQSLVAHNSQYISFITGHDLHIRAWYFSTLYSADATYLINIFPSKPLQIEYLRQHHHLTSLPQINSSLFGPYPRTLLPFSTPNWCQFMHQFHISQVVFIIPRIRSRDKLRSLIVFPFCRIRGFIGGDGGLRDTSYPSTRCLFSPCFLPYTLHHLHSRRQLLKYLNFSFTRDDESCPPCSSSKNTIRDKLSNRMDAFQLLVGSYIFLSALCDTTSRHLEKTPPMNISDLCKWKSIELESRCFLAGIYIHCHSARSMCGEIMRNLTFRLASEK